MKTIAPQPNLVDQVKEALLEEVLSGRIKPGERVIQEQIAQALGVSRQPVQQAFLLLRNQGLFEEAVGRGVVVAHLNPKHVRDVYDIRAAIEGMACRRAANLVTDAQIAQGHALLDAGRKGVAAGHVTQMIASDIKFHELIYKVSGNQLVEATMATHLTYTMRVMSEVLLKDEEPRDIWAQHTEIWEAIERRDGEAAERIATTHLLTACDFMVRRLMPSA